MKSKLFLFLILTFTSITAQSVQKHAIYTTSEINFIKQLGINWGINYVYNEKYSASFGVTSSTRFSKSKPNDYSSGVSGVLSFGLLVPRDDLINYHINVGKIYKLNESGTSRVNLSLGVGYSLVNRPINWQKTKNNGIGSNYSWENYKISTMSLIINPKFEFPFTRYFGLSISPMIEINKEVTFVGIGFGTMLGVLKAKN